VPHEITPIPRNQGFIQLNQKNIQLNQRLIQLNQKNIQLNQRLIQLNQNPDSAEKDRYPLWGLIIADTLRLHTA
jgi:hypothetical protein